MITIFSFYRHEDWELENVADFSVVETYVYTRTYKYVYILDISYGSGMAEVMV